MVTGGAWKRKNKHGNEDLDPKNSVLEANGSEGGKKRWSRGNGREDGTGGGRAEEEKEGKMGNKVEEEVEAKDGIRESAV